MEACTREARLYEIKGTLHDTGVTENELQVQLYTRSVGLDRKELTRKSVIVVIFYQFYCINITNGWSSYGFLYMINNNHMPIVNSFLFFQYHLVFSFHLAHVSYDVHKINITVNKMYIEQHQIKHSEHKMYHTTSGTCSSLEGLIGVNPLPT